MLLSTGVNQQVLIEETLTNDSLFEKLGATHMHIEVTLDEEVDPPEYRIIQTDELGQEKLLYAHPAEYGLGVFELIQVLDRIGFYVDYTERK